MVERKVCFISEDGSWRGRGEGGRMPKGQLLWDDQWAGPFKGEVWGPYAERRR